MGDLEKQYQAEGMGAEIEDTKSENLEFSQMSNQMSNKGHSMTVRTQRF